MNQRLIKFRRELDALLARHGAVISAENSEPMARLLIPSNKIYINVSFGEKDDYAEYILTDKGELK